jgi:putative transcriptional regulator
MARDKEFESKLMRLRNLRRMNQTELGKELGVSTTTIMKWETGRAVPRLTVRQVKTLVKVLGITLDELPDDFGPQRIVENN